MQIFVAAYSSRSAFGRHFTQSLRTDKGKLIILLMLLIIVLIRFIMSIVKSMITLFGVINIFVNPFKALQNDIIRVT